MAAEAVMTMLMTTTTHAHAHTPPPRTLHPPHHPLQHNTIQ
jgi:hypothetical protein